MMLYTDPPKHTRYRRLVNKGFTPRMIGLLEQYLRTGPILIVDDVIERGECDFVTDLAAELPLQAIAEIMGVPQEDRHKLFDWSNRMIGADDPEYEATASDGDAADRSCSCTPTRSAEQRQADPRDDIVTKLINAEIDGDRLTELEFDMFFLLLTVAGNETTRNATRGGMRALMREPRPVRQAARPTSTASSTGAIEEILRWATPVHALPPHGARRHRDPRPGDQAGDKVVMWHISANRDEDGLRRPVHVRHRALAERAHRLRRRRRRTSASAPTWPAWSCKLIFQEILERHPRHAARPARSRCLRSNFIGGIKHMPVAYARA